MFLMVATRIDLCYALALVSRYNASPNTSHWAAVLLISRL